MPSSSAARRFVTTDALEQRYRRALADTHDQLPRPVSSLELPLKADKLMTPQLMASLRPAAVLVPLVRRAEGLQLLLTRRADHLRSHSGQVSFPGGRCEDTDASLAATALREAEAPAAAPASLTPEPAPPTAEPAPAPPPGGGLAHARASALPHSLSPPTSAPLGRPLQCFGWRARQ